MIKKINYKGFILVGFVTVLIILCGSFTNKSDEVTDVNYNYELTEKYMNGHYYVVGTKGTDGISVMHSPNCRCNRH